MFTAQGDTVWHLHDNVQPSYTQWGLLSSFVSHWARFVQSLEEEEEVTERFTAQDDTVWHLHNNIQPSYTELHTEWGLVVSSLLSHWARFVRIYKKQQNKKRRKSLLHKTISSDNFTTFSQATQSYTQSEALSLHC